MMINNTLIRQFFQNECSEKEALAVIRYLAENPEKLDEFVPQLQWDSMDDVSLMSVDKKREIMSAVRKDTGIRRVKQRAIWQLAVAASLTVILAVALWLQVDFGQHKVEGGKKLTSNHTAYTLVKINYGKEDMLLNIIDGSVIYLKPGGELRYLEHLSKTKREFHLKGVARFKVAKDKTRPFSVYADGVVTTALGTDFTISSAAEDENVSVTLHSGKVVVSPDSSVNTKGMKKNYLLPGNKLIINKINFTVSLIKQGDKSSDSIVESKGQTELTATTISFRNESLDNIFRMLKREYATVVLFDNREVKGMFFTGSFKRNEQIVDNILNEIALLNHLNLTKKGNDYILILKSKNNK